MTGRFALITLLVVMGIVFLAIILGMYFRFKKPGKSGKPLLEEAVNEETNTEKMELSELLVYVSAILVAGFFALKAMGIIGTGSAPLGSAILVPPVMALFNARKRTGRTIFIFMVVAIMSLYLFMAYMIIGSPVKAPTFTINDTEITMAHTKVSDILKDGFDIYIKQEDTLVSDYDQMLSSGVFKKYPGDRSFLVEKGFRRNTENIYYNSYLLVKDDIIIGSIGLYGNKTKDTVLEDCKITCLRLEENCIAAARENSIKYALNGVELMTPLKQEELENTFGENLWLVPPKGTVDVTQLHYGIKWTTGSDHLFWNEYFAYIDFDEQSNMTTFEISTEIARDTNQ